MSVSAGLRLAVARDVLSSHLASFVDARARTADRPKPSRESRLASVIATQHALLSGELSLAAVMNVVCRQAQELIGADSAGVAMSQGQALSYVAVVGPASMAIGSPLAPDGSLTGLALTTRKTLYSEDCFADPRVDDAVCRDANAQSMIAVPLRAGARSIGVLTACFAQPRAFDAQDVEILELMAGLVAAAVARAAEYDARQQLTEEREQAARTMEQQTEMLRLVFESAPQLIGVLQMEEDDLRHVAANPAVARLFQLPVEQILGRTSRELAESGEANILWKQKLQEAARTGVPVHFEYTATRGGKPRVMSGTVSALPLHPDEPHRRFAYVCEDITSRSELREQLSLSERMACVGRLAAGVAHEVNNPLAYVNSNTAFVVEELSSEEALADPARIADMRAALTDALGGVDRVVQIVRDLQTFVRSEDGLDGMLDLPFVVTRCISITHHETKLKAQVTPSLGVAPPVKGNEGQMAQVIAQLIVNAAQAIRSDGRPDLHHIRVTTGTTQNGDAFLEVSDDGEGMAPEVLKCAFEPFFTTRNEGPSTGMGLAVCRNIVQAHRGELTIRSEPDRGTTMRIELPSSIA